MCKPAIQLSNILTLRVLGLFLLVTQRPRAIVNTYRKCCVRKKIARINLSSYDVVTNPMTAERTRETCGI